MNRLCVPLAAITENGLAIDAEFSASELQTGDAPEIPLGHIAVRGTLTEAAHEYIFRGEVSGAHVHACDRCLEEVRKPFRVEITWVFEQGPASSALDELTDDEPEDDDVKFAFDRDEIDLAPHVWEEAVLAAPAKFLCKEDCAGLCPRCGANLNRGECRCRQEDTMENKGFAGLADMFPEFRAKHSEE